MEKEILTGAKMPFCPGCGHGPSVRYVSKALTECGFKPLDVVLVSDIGCSGLVDPLFNTHTIHGLHGRSPALAMGVVMGLNNIDKKVIAIQGDGGATIGLQHLLEASRRNVNMTLIVLNNLIYGMTGGQVSGLSTNEFKNDKHIPDEAPPFDVCQLAHQAGAAYVARVNDPKNITDKLVRAFNTPGFSLVEIPSLCQPYGAKKMDQLMDWSREEVMLRHDRPMAQINVKETKSLINDSQVLQQAFDSSVTGRIGIMIAGSAGGGVQLAAKLLASAGILSGLSASMKGEYPITVGTGFSVAEIILAKDEINYTGLEKPDVVIIVTNDGLLKIKNRIGDSATIYLDAKVEAPESLSAAVFEFSTIAGKKGSALCAIAHWLEASGLLELAALKQAARSHKYGDELIKIIDSATELLVS
jgi:2-oxoglutarate/2-oxoacid ferredoxin oxidoreductase subunit beta